MSTETLIPDNTPRVEVVDNHHAGWPLVLELLDELGHRDAISLDENGWLPARQRMLVAFVDDKPAAHLSFHIHPIDRQNIEAHLDVVGFGPAGKKLSRPLRDAAMKHAQTLRCTVFRGIEDIKDPTNS
jgi:hypothetical protein